MSRRGLDLDMLDTVLDTLRKSQAHTIAPVEHPNGTTVVELRNWEQGVWRAVELWPSDVEQAADPDADPDTTRCHTGMCLAGWVVELDPAVSWEVTPRAMVSAMRARDEAGRIAKEDDPDKWRDYRHGVIGATTDALHAYATACDHYDHIESRQAHVVDQARPSSYGTAATYARQRLGLTASQADALFTGTNDLDDLEHIVEHLRTDPTWELDESVGQCEDCGLLSSL